MRRARICCWLLHTRGSASGTPVCTCHTGCPQRHLEAAEALGANVAHLRDDDAGEVLADRISWFMQRLKVPNGLSAIGYTVANIPALVEGTLPQHRVTKLSPRPAGPEELGRLFEQAMVAW